MYFRAYYGVPDSIRAPDGTPVNAVRGLLDFIARLVGDYSPGAMCACWDDDWRPQWRVDLIPSYKAHRVVEEVTGAPDREITPDPLEAQVPLIREALALLGIAVVGAEGYEADDVIGTLAARWNGPVDVVTGDRDLFQVIDDDREVRVLYIARGVGRHERLDARAVVSRYRVLPSQYPDFAVMRGDASDGLPGVAGIGEKTAADLLATHGDLDAIIAAAQDPDGPMTGALRSRIRAAADYLAVAPAVVRVATDLDLGTPDLELQPLADQQREAFAAFAEQWGLGGSATRVLAALDALDALDK
ncbi:MAG: 5'-3' exonuclease [Nocardioidaceae bacterium]|nr:5'-3' exonuclease [Nocardioidaceae bacterium]